MSRKNRSVFKYYIYVSSGFLSVSLAILGLLLPLLPTTPFLLLAAFLFARSSHRWHRWLLTHRVFGPYILAFREKRGLTIEQKWRIAGAITVTLVFSAWMTPHIALRALVCFIWVNILVFLFFIRTACPTKGADEIQGSTP